MRTISFLITALLLFHTVTGISAEENTELNKTLLHEGKKRTYYIHLPPGFKKEKPAPLVIALHGGGGNARSLDLLASRGTLRTAADKRGIVLVFPDALNKEWWDGREKIPGRGGKRDDVGFISKLIDEMIKAYGIDPERVYVTGMSNGGFMSIRLAMDLSEKIAAIAPVVAQIPKNLEKKRPKLPISVMIINGTKDPIVPFDGGHVRLFKLGRSRGEILSAADSIEIFRDHNHCAKTPEISKVEDKDPKDGATVEIEKYTGGKLGTEVILVKVIGGSHAWPNGKRYLRSGIVVCRDINASEMILDFFLKHSRKR
jgi:polyhydroxybutyrate depolymerase